MVQEQQLVIFTRYPTPGKTKTRLISHLGSGHAAQLQKEMTEHIVRHACRANSRVEVRYTGGTLLQMQNWLGADLGYAEQGDGDLGERMQRTFADHFSAGATRVVIAGSDCPSNNWKNMEHAFHALETNDCVIGPADDGGYYLIGLTCAEIRGHRPRLQQGGAVAGGADPAFAMFSNIDWGGELVLEQTLVAASSLTLHQLPTLHDVDLPEDIPARISVIIPTLNEEAHLARTLEKVKEGFGVEILVVDGGSTDGTSRIVERQLSYFSKCDHGRAAQQNLGGQMASGKILFFLHADTILPDGWDWMVRDTLADPAVALGAFSFKVHEPFPGQKLIEDTANWRSKSSGLPYGDQGLFMRREVFEQAGGFPDMPIMEDYAFVRELQKLGNVVTRPEAAVTSGRRWQQHGVFKVTLINKLMIVGYHLGIPPEKLAAFYRK